MTKEAEGMPNGIIVDWTKLNVFPDAAGMQHCEVTSVLDLYPSWVPMRFQKSWAEQNRPDTQIENCDPSVRARFALSAVSEYGVSQPYRPIPLRNDPELVQFYGPNASANG
jgi:hypothetical protein